MQQEKGKVPLSEQILVDNILGVVSSFVFICQFSYRILIQKLLKMCKLLRKLSIAHLLCIHTRGVAWGGTLDLQSHLVEKIKNEKIISFISVFLLSLVKLNAKLVSFSSFTFNLLIFGKFIWCCKLELGVLLYKDLQIFYTKLTAILKCWAK